MKRPNWVWLTFYFWQLLAKMCVSLVVDVKTIQIWCLSCLIFGVSTLFAKSIVADHIEEGWKQKARQRSSHLFGGKNFVQFLATLAVLSRSIWKKRLNSTVSFNWLQLFIPKSTVTLKTSSAARNQTNVAPQNDVTTFAYAFCFHPSFMWQTLQLRNISPRSSITWKVYKIVNSQKVANTQIWTRTRKFHKKIIGENLKITKKFGF